MRPGFSTRPDRARDASEWFVLPSGLCVPIRSRKRPENFESALQHELRRAADLNRQAVWFRACARRWRRKSNVLRLRARTMVAPLTRSIGGVLLFQLLGGATEH